MKKPVTPDEVKDVVLAQLVARFDGRPVDVEDLCRGLQLAQFQIRQAYVFAPKADSETPLPKA